jgi:hypothetical protein
LEDLDEAELEKWGFDLESLNVEKVIEHANKRVALCAYTKIDRKTTVLSDSAFEGLVFLSYVTSMEKSGTFATFLECAALSRIMKHPVVVITGILPDSGVLPMACFD